MPWAKGQSGNPRGRPKKPRQLTTQLETELSRTVELADGTKISGKRYAASIIRQAITYGEVTLANGKTMELTPDDIIALLRWAYAQVDGPPKHEVDVTSGGEPITVVNVGVDMDRL